jgi:hypothetical protein
MPQYVRMIQSNSGSWSTAEGPTDNLADLKKNQDAAFKITIPKVYKDCKIFELTEIPRDND